MIRTVYRFEFAKDVEFDDVADAIVLARVAAEGVHGEAQVRLDAAYGISERHRFCFVDATDALGATVARVLTALLMRTLGEDAFEVERRLYEEAARPLPTDDGARR